ncbi:MAG: S8 family serine peptidase, partial [Gammaproteobacteria bacterium]|nr:S8 family serine peptidase [Gammaproteobacteria bacterium]
HLITEHDKMLADVGAADRKVYSYCHALNGFAAKLTAAEAAQLRGNKAVANVWEDYAYDLETNNSPEFLGLNDKTSGLHERYDLRGEDIIVGVMDTGAVQEHPSFSDSMYFDMPKWCKHPSTSYKETLCENLKKHRSKVLYDEPPAHWSGICQAGEAWSEDDCNNKLIGARWYVDGFLAGNGSVLEGEFLSARDSDGHGSHTASTATGNKVMASLGGTPLTKISGMAPRARVAIYKVCWAGPADEGCFFSDSAAATDQAVADGVDVLSFSVGTSASIVDPQDIAFLDAASAGVFVARSAGNSGPAPFTTNAGAPWVTSVAASTLDGTGFALAATVNSPAAVAGDYAALEGAITKSLIESGPITDDLVAADPIDACVPLANDIGGKIALIARGTCSFVAKVENAANAGASAVLMYSDARPKTAMGGTATELTRTIPGVMIDNAPGLALLAELEAMVAVNASMSAGNYITEQLDGNIMAGFSSRGPFSTEQDWIKPDITAPGVRILAASTPDRNDGSAGDVFAYLQGTSMSTPHIAGLGALVRQAHPNLSGAEVKSALMTSARQDVYKEDGVTPADPFDYGSGHVDPNKAINPGLVYHAGLLDYLAASCGTVSPLLSPGDCDFIESALGFSTQPADLNLPSIGISELPGTQTVRRTVTAAIKYRKHNKSQDYEPREFHAQVQAPEGFDVHVSPSVLHLAPGYSADYEVTITNESAPPGEWRFGELVWRENTKGKKGRHNPKGIKVRSPIAVNAKAVVAPVEVFGEGGSGTLSFDVTFGYDGPYDADRHGLNNPNLYWLTVEDDPGNSFQFFGPGTFGIIIEVPADQAFARWSLFNEYTSGNDDMDVYLYYCPGFLCTQIDSSGNGDSNEEVSVT